MAFVRTPNQFYLVRFLLGICEAGFFPGVIIYLTHWFIHADRARALSGLIMAVPFSLAFGAPVSSLLLQIHWLGFAGWQWMFILEGFPAVVLGIITLFYLPDHPRDAKWLSPAARERLTTALESEKIAPVSSSISQSFRHVLTQRTVWLLALGIFCTNVGGYALVFWLPTTIQNLSGGTPASSVAWTTLPYCIGLFAAWWSGQSSDKRGERKWHCVAGQTGTAVFLALSAIPGQSFPLVMTWLSLSGFAAFFWGTPFWALPTAALAPSAAAIAVGFINICANLAGFVGSPIIGRLRDHGLSPQNCLLLLAACYLVGAMLVALVPVRRGTKT
jgi:ACS family tartrate transporter-like MFS transporter